MLVSGGFTIDAMFDDALLNSDSELFQSLRTAVRDAVSWFLFLSTMLAYTARTNECVCNVNYVIVRDSVLFQFADVIAGFHDMPSIIFMNSSS